MNVNQTRGGRRPTISIACSSSNVIAIQVFRRPVRRAKNAATKYTSGHPSPTRSRIEPVKFAIARWTFAGSLPACHAITASTANSGRVWSQARIASARPCETRNCAASAPHATRNAENRIDGNVQSAVRGAAFATSAVPAAESDPFIQAGFKHTDSHFRSSRRKELDSLAHHDHARRFAFESPHPSRGQGRRERRNDAARRRHADRGGARRRYTGRG